MLSGQDIDVFASHKEKELSFDHLPNVEAFPVMPDMRQAMDVDLVVNAEGRVYIFYDGEISEETEYVLYSIDDSTLNLVSHNGRIQDIGMKVHKPMRQYMRKADYIYMIAMRDGHPDKIIHIPMIIHEIGL